MMKSKMMAGGGMMKKMAAGGMPMVMKDGKKVPAFAADGEGKMAKGGMAKAKMAAGGGMMKKGYASGIGESTERATFWLFLISKPSARVPWAAGR